ncbi:MAG TPA: ATP synthase F1 subunit delta [bacterium]|nr:ATP synthase F1 subunit delta [bacterium]
MSDPATRYAQALLDGVKGPASAATALFGHGRDLVELLAAEDDLRRFLESPAFGRDEKRELLAVVGARCGYESALLNLCGALVDNHRIGLLATVLDRAERLWRRRQGIAELEVSVARPLADDEESDLRRVLAERFGKTAEARFTVDPAVLEGLVVKKDSVCYDASLRNHIRLLRDRLREGKGR